MSKIIKITQDIAEKIIKQTDSRYRLLWVTSCMNNNSKPQDLFIFRFNGGITLASPDIYICADRQYYFMYSIPWNYVEKAGFPNTYSCVINSGRFAPITDKSRFLINFDSFSDICGMLCKSISIPPYRREGRNNAV